MPRMTIHWSAALLLGTCAAWADPPGATDTLPAAPTAASPAAQGTAASSPGPATALPKLVVTDTEPDAYTKPVASTGTRTDTPVMDTPLNVQVVTQQVMQDEQDTRIDQVLRNVSGIAFTGGGDTSFGNAWDSIVLRGFSTDSHLRDGMRIDTAGGDTELYTQQLANVESVEVLKGPAAVLYGAVEPGGVVNIIPKQPQATPAYEVQQAIGSYSASRTVLDATGPLTASDKLLYRVDASYEDARSIVDLGFNRSIFIAPTLQWLASAATKFTLEVEFKDAQFNGNYAITPLVQASNGQFFPLSDDPHLNYGEESGVRERTETVSLKWTHDFNAQWNITQQLLVEWMHNKAPQVTLSGLGPVDPSNPNSAPAVYRFESPFDNVNQTYSTDIDVVGHFNTGSLSHTLLFGGDAYRVENNSLLTDTNLTFGPDPSVDSIISLYNPVHPANAFGPPQFLNHSNGPIDSEGVYVQDQFSYAERWFAMIGARYQHAYNNDVSVGLYGNSVPFGGGQKLTPRFGLVWRPEDWVSLYASYASSWSPSGGEVLVTGGLAPNREGHQKEVGFKFQAFHETLNATLSAYDLLKTNIPNQDPANQAVYFLSGAVRSRGLEFDLDGQILPGWNLIATFSDMDARIVRNNDPSNPPGTQWSGAPRLIGNLWSTYEFTRGPHSAWTVGGGVNAQGDTPALNYSGVLAPQTSDYTRIPGYATFNLMGRYRYKTDRHTVSLQFNASNLANRRYQSYIELTNPQPYDTYTYNGETYGVDRRLYGEPRILKMAVSVQF